MTHYGKHPPLRDAPHPDDPVWQWFVLNGPHGEAFRWAKDTPARRDLELLREFIQQNETSSPGFENRAHAVAREALTLENPVLVRTGIQVLTVIGDEDDLAVIETLLRHPDPRVARDAGAALFERGVKVGKRRPPN